MIRLFLALLIALCCCSPAGAIQAPVYISKTEECVPYYKDGVLWVDCDPQCVSPATEEEWPDINIVQDEIDYWNNHAYFPFFADDDFAVYLTKCKLEAAGVAGKDEIWISSGGVYADKESTEYTYGEGTMLASEGALRKVLVHEICHKVADHRFNQVERESFLTLIGEEFTPGENLVNIEIDHKVISWWFLDLWGSHEDNSWVGMPVPLVGPWYEYKYYYAFYDCMINDHAEFIDYSTIPNRTRGDVDDNGKIDCADLDLISTMKNSNAYYNDFGRFWSADYNGDNVVDEKDVELVAGKVGSCRVYVNRPQPDREQVRKKCEDVRRNIKERLGNYNRIRLN